VRSQRGQKWRWGDLRRLNRILMPEVLIAIRDRADGVVNGNAGDEDPNDAERRAEVCACSGPGVARNAEGESAGTERGIVLIGLQGSEGMERQPGGFDVDVLAVGVNGMHIRGNGQYGGIGGSAHDPGICCQRRCEQSARMKQAFIEWLCSQC